MLSTPVGRLRAVGLCEGVSFLALLGIAMPLKYLAGLPMAVKVVGWVHGLLFILFLLALVEASLAQRWPWRRVLAAVVAAVVPFGPFVLDAQLRGEASEGCGPLVEAAPPSSLATPAGRGGHAPQKAIEPWTTIQPGRMQRSVREGGRFMSRLRAKVDPQLHFQRAASRGDHLPR